MEPGPLATLALGFLLGMEHALDADHVVAGSPLGRSRTESPSPRMAPRM